MQTPPSDPVTAPSAPAAAPPAKRPKKAASTSRGTTTKPGLRMSAELRDQIREAARGAGMSEADYHRYALRMALGLQSATGAVTEMEGRVAATMRRLERRLRRIEQIQQFHLAYLDQYAKLTLALEPDLVTPDAEDAARRLGMRRHKNLVESVPGALGGQVAKAFSVFLENLPDETE